MRLIDKDSLIDYIEKFYDTSDQQVQAILKEIEAEPVRHGKWIDCTSSDHYKCSKCGYKAPLWWDGEEYEEWLSQYCPHCGARMEGVEDENAD